MEMEQKPSAPHKILRKLKENSESIHISRIPQKAKQSFIMLANDEFCNDYGLTFRDILEKAEEYKIVKSRLFKLIEYLEHIQAKKDGS